MVLETQQAGNRWRVNDLEGALGEQSGETVPSSLFSKELVRKGGFEPPRSCERQPLKLVRLPVPPLPHKRQFLVISCQHLVLSSHQSAVKPEWRQYGFLLTTEN